MKPKPSGQKAGNTHSFDSPDPGVTFILPILNVWGLVQGASSPAVSFVWSVSPNDCLWTLEKILGMLTVSHFSLNRSVTVSVDRRDSYSFFSARSVILGVV